MLSCVNKSQLGVKRKCVCIHKCLMYTLESDLETSNLQTTLPSAHATNITVKNLVSVV